MSYTLFCRGHHFQAKYSFKNIQIGKTRAKKQRNRSIILKWNGLKLGHRDVKLGQVNNGGQFWWSVDDLSPEWSPGPWAQVKLYIRINYIQYFLIKGTCPASQKSKKMPKLTNHTSNMPLPSLITHNLYHLSNISYTLSTRLYRSVLSDSIAVLPGTPYTLSARLMFHSL